MLRNEIERMEEGDEGYESSDYEEPYIDMFGNHKRKGARLGNTFQANKIPLITDIQYFEYL